MEGSATAASILSDAMGTVQSDMMSAIGTVVPVALTIAAGILVIRIGWRIFKGLAK